MQLFFFGANELVHSFELVFFLFGNGDFLRNHIWFNMIFHFQ